MIPLYVRICLLEHVFELGLFDMELCCFVGLEFRSLEPHFELLSFTITL